MFVNSIIEIKNVSPAPTFLSPVSQIRLPEIGEIAPGAHPSAPQGLNDIFRPPIARKVRWQAYAPRVDKQPTEWVPYI